MSPAEPDGELPTYFGTGGTGDTGGSGRDRAVAEPGRVVGRDRRTGPLLLIGALLGGLLVWLVVGDTGDDSESATPTSASTTTTAPTTTSERERRPVGTAPELPPPGRVEAPPAALQGCYLELTRTDDPLAADWSARYLGFRTCVEETIAGDASITEPPPALDDPTVACWHGMSSRGFPFGSSVRARYLNGVAYDACIADLAEAGILTDPDRHWRARGEECYLPYEVLPDDAGDDAWRAADVVAESCFAPVSR